MGMHTLNSGREIPAIGLGVYQLADHETPEKVGLAIDAGYRLFDTASMYGNEEGVGRAIRAADVARDELLVTTKLYNDSHGYDNALRAFDESTKRLGLETVDLYLIHWPCPGRGRYVETWKAFETLYAEGRARAIGVSNFTTAHLERLLATCDVVPAVNQIELHPWFPQKELRAFHARHGIATEAWGPLGQGRGVLDEPAILAIARAKSRSPAQVVLRWHIEVGAIPIPKSADPQRIRENLDVFSFALDEDDLATMDRLARDQRLGPDPEVVVD
jgi:2,5-diketo-D-gluconate reductase A